MKRNCLEKPKEETYSRQNNCPKINSLLSKFTIKIAVSSSKCNFSHCLYVLLVDHWSKVHGQQVEKMRAQAEHDRRKYANQEARVYASFVVFWLVLFLLSSCATTHTGGSSMSTITLTQA